MRQSRWARWLAVLLAFTLLAAACGGDDDDATGDDAAESDDSAAPAEEEPAEEPADEVTEEQEDAIGTVDIDEAANCATAIDYEPGEYAPSGTLNYGVQVVVNSLNPHDDQSPATFAFYSWQYEGLVRSTPDGTIAPWLAKCWETSEDGSVVTFYLHEGVSFHDGSPFDAEAVVANVEFVKTAEPPQVIPPVKGQLGIVESVTAVDELTVQFDLTGPGEVLLLSGLARNSGFMVSPDALGSAAQNPIGTGPYVIESTNSDATEVDMVAFSDYWRPEDVGVENVALRAVPDVQARLDAFNAGQFDVATLNPNQRAAAEGEIATAPTVRIGFVVNDWQGERIPQLANKDVRCAMAQAINGAGISAQMGAPDSATRQWALKEGDYAYIDDLDVAEFDVEAAKAAFEATGEEGFTFDNGHLPVSVFPPLSSAWSSALAEFGITMNNEVLDPPSGGEMFGRLSRNVYPIQVIPWNEPNALMSLIARTGEAGFNPSKASPEGVTELVASARGKNFEDGEADVAAAWKILIEECVWMPVLVLNTLIGHSSSVSGLEHTVGIPAHFWPQGVRVG